MSHSYHGFYCGFQTASYSFLPCMTRNCTLIYLYKHSFKNTILVVEERTIKKLLDKEECHSFTNLSNCAAFRILTSTGKWLKILTAMAGKQYIASESLKCLVLSWYVLWEWSSSLVTNSPSWVLLHRQSKHNYYWLWTFKISNREKSGCPCPILKVSLKW